MLANDFRRVVPSAVSGSPESRHLGAERQGAERLPAQRNREGFPAQGQAGRRAGGGSRYWLPILSGIRLPSR
jgi:hypothetical protein